MNDIFDTDINNVTKIDNIIGNNIVKDMIQNMVEKMDIPNLLICGQNGCGKNYILNVLINNLFKDKKYIINNNQLLISNIILDFIKGNKNTNKIVHVALDDKDITDVVEFFSNSLKDNNLTVFEFIKLLNVDYFIEFNKDSKFIITDIYLDEKEYKLLDYINL